MPLDPTELQHRCLEADAWCESALAEPGYRTPALRMELGEWPSTKPLHLACEALVERRRQLLSGVNSTEAGGAVVVCAVDETVSCGASEAASDGFFDVNDQPPWDTWLGVVDAGGGSPLLLAWVPTRDVRLVDQGIAVNPVDCIYWLESRGGDVRRPDVLDQFLEPRGPWIPRDDGPPAEPRELLSSPRMPQTPRWLPIALGAGFLTAYFGFQALLPSDYRPWLPPAVFLAVLAIVALMRRSD